MCRLYRMRMVFFLLVSFLLASCETSNDDQLTLDDGGLTRKLKIELVSFQDGADKQLHEKIRRFDEERSDIEVEISERFTVFYDMGFSPWLVGKKGTGDPPDLIELTPNQMKVAFHHGKLETLNMDQPQLKDLVITSPDGYVIGVKSKINPLIMYYNQDTFLELGLEAPSEDWDWAMLDNTIAALKAARKNVYIMLSPSILEWVTMSRYGGRIVDTSGTMFSGYMDSEETIQAAEWLKWVGTREEDYRLRTGFANIQRYDPMPLDLIEGNMALAIDFAHDLQISRTSNFEAIVQRNDRVGIAPLPGGFDDVNVAHTAGLVIPAYSENKDLAMELLRYLTKDIETYYEDILWYTLQANSSIELDNPRRISTLLLEMKRSIPTSLRMSEAQSHARNFDHFASMRRAIMEGEPIKTILEQKAQELDVQFELFLEDLESYEECIMTRRRVCY